MLTTYKAILKNNHLEWHDVAPGQLSPDKALEVHVTILDELTAPSTNGSQGERMAAALEQLAALGTLAKIAEPEARYVTSAEGQPVAVLLTLEEYEHYLDLLDDEADSQDAELATRLTQAASRPAEDRLSFRDYLRQRETTRAEEVQS